MYAIRRADERGLTSIGWLDSRHTFSFGDYRDASFVGFGPLRVINEDRVQPGAGFPAHSHRDMEILSWVLSGALEHQDSTGSKGVIRPGELQRMTAGTGITHSEYNASRIEPVHFLQIWLVPEVRGLAPGYEQKIFPSAELEDRWRLIASRGGRDGSVRVHQDVDLYAAHLDAGQEVEHEPGEGRRIWLQAVRGSIEVDGDRLEAGDAAYCIARHPIRVRTAEFGEALLFDMTP